MLELMHVFVCVFKYNVVLCIHIQFADRILKDENKIQPQFEKSSCFEFFWRVYVSIALLYVCCLKHVLHMKFDC